MAFRDLRSSAVDEGHFAMTDKLLILDTEGLGSLDKVKRLKGKDINFDRCMVLFCLTVANALIITLKTEIDNETADLLSVCCWALQNLKINKMSPPTGVQANPVTTPDVLVRSATSLKNRIGPRMDSIASAVI